MGRAPIRLVPAAALLPLLSCAHSFQTPADFPAARAFQPVASAAAPAADELVDAFYRGEEPFDELAARVEALLAAHPDHGGLNEVAALLAELRADVDAATLSWLAAAADLRSDLTEFYIAMAERESHNVRTRNAAMDLYARIEREHPRATARAAAAHARAGALNLMARHDEAAAALDGLGVVRQWWVIGTFDNDQGKGFLTPHPPERSIDITGEYEGLRTTARWHAIETARHRWVLPLSHILSPNRHAVAYAMTQVRAPKSGPAHLRLSTGVPVRAWLNGELVISEEKVDRFALDNRLAPVTLREGLNTLLVKSANQSGDWSLGARITAEDGAIIAGLQGGHSEGTMVGPSGSVRDIDGRASSTLLERVNLLPDGPRKDFLRAMAHTEVGSNERALESAQAALGSSPDQPVVVYHGALKHWNSGELGRAIDLLNEGLAMTPPSWPGFLRKRARFYRQRKLYRRAQTDLEEVINQNPDSRIARLRLAELLENQGWEAERCRVLDEVLERWPDSGWAHRVKSDCLVSQGYRERAEAEYLQAHTLEPGRLWDVRNLAHYASRRYDYARAFELYERAIANEPLHSPTHLSYGDVLRYAGRREEARAQYRLAIGLDSGWASPHQRLGAMAVEDGDLEAAHAFFVDALTRNPEDTALAERIEALEGTATALADAMQPSEAELEEAVTAEVEMKPGAQTIWLLDHEVTTVGKDGTARRAVTTVVRAASERGRDALIRQRVPRGARIIQAYSRSTDGARQEASSIRGGTIRFRQLQVGSTVVIQYVHHQGKGKFLPNHYAGSWSFQGVNEQREKSEWLLLVPDPLQLSVDLNRGIDGAAPLEHTTEKRGDYTLHRFYAENIPPLLPEPMMSPARDLIWSASVSTVPDWKEYVDWERALLTTVFRSNPDVGELAHKLTKDAKTPREKVDAIFHYVAEEIRYQQDYENTIAGVKPHACPVVLERGYGDCKDKALLMMMMAKELGMKLEFAILRTRPAGQFRQKTPNQQFNHAIVYVPEQAGIDAGFFVDPTTDGLDIGNLRADNQGVTSLVLDPETGTHRFIDIPFQTPDLQQANHHVTIELISEKEAKAEYRLTQRGTFASMLRRLVRNREQASKAFQSIISQWFPGGKLDDWTIENHEDIVAPVELTLKLDLSAALRVDAGKGALKLPPVHSVAGWIRLDERRTPLDLGVPSASDVKIEVKVPKGHRFVKTPAAYNAQHECVNLERTAKTTGNQLVVELNMERRCTRVEPADYAGFRDALRPAEIRARDELEFTLPQGATTASL